MNKNLNIKSKWTLKIKAKKKKERKVETDSHREWTNGYQWREGREEGQDRYRGLRYKLLCIG